MATICGKLTVCEHEHEHRFAEHEHEQDSEPVAGWRFARREPISERDFDTDTDTDFDFGFGFGFGFGFDEDTFGRISIRGTKCLQQTCDPTLALRTACFYRNLANQTRNPFIRSASPRAAGPPLVKKFLEALTATMVAIVDAVRELKILPVREAFATYRAAPRLMDPLGNDLRAGFNVALLAFPQGMAYAQIAGLPIEYGIYGSAFAAIFGALFAGSRFIMLGPTNATSVLLFTTLLDLGLNSPADIAVALPILVGLAGIFLIIGAYLQVANLIQYISRTVVTGYITAAALYIIINQIRKAAGFTFDIPEGTTFLGVVALTIENLYKFQWPSVILSLITAAIFWSLQARFRKLPNVAITLILMSFVAVGINAGIDTWAASENGSVKDIEALHFESVEMLTAISVADFRLTPPALDGQLMSKLALPALLIAFLCILEGSSIGKSLAARAGARLDTNQEMLNMGIANMACAFGMGMPASGSLTRSQLGWSSGSATQFASLYCGLFVTTGAILLGHFIQYIPTPALAVLVIAIGIGLIDQRVIRIVCKTTKSDAIVFAVTFSVALLIRLDVAIIMGAATSILLFLRKAAMPELVEYTFSDDAGLVAVDDENRRQQVEISIVHVEGNLFFGATELFRDQMRRVVEDPNLKVVVLKLRNAHHLDATSVMVLEELVKFMRQTDRHLIISEAREDTIRVLANSGIIHVVGGENIFADDARNPTLSTAKALRRAHTIIGDDDIKVSIYAGKPKPLPGDDEAESNTTGLDDGKQG